MSTNTLLTPCKQGAVLSRYSYAPKVKNAALKIKPLPFRTLHHQDVG